MYQMRWYSFLVHLLAFYTAFFLLSTTVLMFYFLPLLNLFPFIFYSSSLHLNQLYIHKRDTPWKKYSKLNQIKSAKVNRNCTKKDYIWECDYLKIHLHFYRLQVHTMTHHKKSKKFRWDILQISNQGKQIKNKYKQNTTTLTSNLVS